MVFLFMLLAGLLQAADFSDAHLRLLYAPENLWRAEDGRFLGRLEGETIVLTYAFSAGGKPRDKSQLSACPPAPLDCAAAQEAVERSLQMWSEASSGRLIFRRHRGPRRPNIRIAWTGALGRIIGKGAAVPEPKGAEPSPSGWDRPAHPKARQETAALLFNNSYCWYLNKGDCPPETVHPNGKASENNFSVSLVSLHEAGHALGFGHFTNSSIMGLSGGSQRYELTAYDREALRQLYERVAASVR